MKEKTPKDGPGKKRKYRKPDVSEHGSLRGLAERVTGANIMP